MSISPKIPMPVIRLLILGLFILICFMLLEIKLWREQLYRGEQYRKRISRQSIRRIRQPSMRGRIFSSDNVPLAKNQPAFDANFYLEEMRRPGKRSNTIKYIIDKERELARLIGRTPTLNKAKILKKKPGLPMCIFRDLSEYERGILYEHTPFIQGLSLESRAKRIYPYGKTACHIIGYTRKADPAKAKDRREFSLNFYRPDLTGKTGIEAAFDSAGKVSNKIRGLRGIPGMRLVRVDHRGFIHETLGEDIAAENGSDIILTINFRAQRIAEKLLVGKKGAIVVMNANTGAVIAMVSAPDYSMRETSPGRIGRLMKSKDSRMLNRAASGTYAPGSLVKPLIGMTLLENGMSPYQTVTCNGYTQIGDAKIRCTGHHGAMDITSALQVSCNDFFVENGLTLGIEKIGTFLQSAGIGTRTGFILHDKRGLLPTRITKYNRTGNRWTAFDTALASIGQGMILITPLQAAVFCSAIANGGKVMRPMLLQEIRDRYGNALYKSKPKVMRRLAASKKNINIVKEGMFRVVNDPHGSGRNAQNPALTLHGKTGTAEIGSRSNRRKNTWFIGFGKHDKTNYSIAVLIENGNSGGRSCAPLAAEFFTSYLGII
jgi:penicillin-binding protein 2